MYYMAMVIMWLALVLITLMGIACILHVLYVIYSYAIAMLPEKKTDDTYELWRAQREDKN